MSHLVLGGTETGQNEEYQMSTILQNGMITPKNSQYPSVQENTDPQSDAIINLIPTTGTQAHGPMLSPQVQWASWRPGQQGRGHHREPRGRGYCRRGLGAKLPVTQASAFLTCGFFHWGCLGLNLGPYVLYHIISSWAIPQSQGVILTLKSNRIWMSCL